MSILISKKELVEQIEELAEAQHQTPEEIVSAAMADYASKQHRPDDNFWESIIGIGNSGDPTFAERDEEILGKNIDPIRGWGPPQHDADTDRH